MKDWLTDNLITIELVFIYILHYLFRHSLYLVYLLISWSLYIDLLITCSLLIRWSAIHYCFVKQLFIINSLISCLLLFRWTAVVRGARSASQQSRGAETSPLSAEGGLWPDPGETDHPWLHATGTAIRCSINNYPYVLSKD